MVEQKYSVDEAPVWLFCQICGHKMAWKMAYHGRVCGSVCHEEFTWREVLYIRNKPYRPYTVAEATETSPINN